ncbi:tetratricopeptide repeat protein [Roseococcus sp. SYP-B2431]|uniref:cellulose biosynthesis protein BcsC n=1 Tax=Roseococcus sp. SYP-B2431 TaxID=2496640 RepID=UPI001038DFC9|nr:cellulose biosynthesis protein BcsC [Roseococcus sp. SYP-B2431]TCH97531.1 tetratricopeptide repeat protein [Roseococcus sp. SYP-B2431]
MRAVPMALLLGGAALGSAAAQTQTVAADPAATAQAPARAVDVLIRQAERWLAQDRPDLAAASIERALAAEPRNTAALAVAARVEAARNNRSGAAAIATRLREAGATEEQRAVAENALRGAAIDRAAIEEARRLAREGQAEAAAARYRQIFGAQGPTPAFAQEYYLALAATQAGAEAGRAGLARLAQSPTATPRARFAFAQNQTFQPATRADGIARLQALAGDPEVGAEARRAWRQALIWGAADPANVPQIQAYLQRVGDDPELRRAMETARTAAVAAPPDPGARLRQEGFAALETGGAAGLRESTSRFEAALAANPRDADALGGLGIVRLREGRAAEARQLLERAVAADPARAQQWQGALDGASYGLELAEARAALRRNDIEGADAVARSAARRQVEDRTDVEVLLGQIALRRGDAPAAEQRFRTALSRRPGFAPARDGLNQALRSQGRIAELPAVQRPPRIAGEAAESIGAGGQLRSEANRSMDPVVAEALLRQALTQQPNDPWTRLDLARALRRQGRAAEGRSVMEEQVARDPRADSLFAAALFADEDNRLADAESYLNRIPPTSRSRDMSQLQARIRTQRDVSRAAAMMASNRAEARTQLLTIAARPDPSGATAAAVIRAFGDANERFGAAEAARVGEAANRGGAPVRIAIAGALLGAGLEAEALALADQADAGTLTPEQRRDVASLRAGIAVRASDRLNDEGRQAQAFERLRPALERDPGNVDANLALARLYQGAREPAEALRIAEGVLARSPRNFDARQGAVSAALALRQRSKAEQLLAEGREFFPNDSRIALMEARIARAFDQDDRARRALETAQAQRQAEIGRVAALPSGVTTTTPGGLQNPFVRPGAAVPLPTVDGRMAVVQPTDRIAREISQELASLEAVNAGRATLTAGLRQRSGTRGLDRLQEISGTAEAEVTPPGIGGRLTATVTGYSLDSSSIATDRNTLQRYGTNAASGTSATPRTTAAGVGLGATYRRGDVFRADIGSSPLGFPTTTILGGLEVAPQIGGVRLRLTGERRSVTDSVLSWAGLRDSVSGRSWGAVVRSGGRAQVEIPVGPGYAYVGGGYSTFVGQNVADNNRVEAGAGFAYPVIGSITEGLTIGTDLVYFGYDQNQRAFTLGNGGYFSPQTFTSVNVPVDYRGRSGDFSYRMGGTVGYAVFRESAAPLYPNDPGLQQQVVARSQTDPTVLTSTPGQSRQTFVGSLRGDVDYAVTPRINLGAMFRYDKSADYDETRVLLRLNGRF